MSEKSRKSFKGLYRENNVYVYAMFLVVTLVTFLAVTYWKIQLGHIALYVFVVALSLLLFVAWSMAVMAVFRSLFVVGAGLSLILFIAQSYCALPTQERIANSSLQTLIGFGLAYISVLFLARMYHELFGNPEAKRRLDQVGTLQIVFDANKGKTSMVLILVLALYAVSIGTILGEVFQVLYPIFNHLCVYR